MLKKCSFLLLLAALPVMAAEIIVQPGDTLWKIAARELGSGHRWSELAAVNQLPEPYLLEPGMKILLPGETRPVPIPEPIEEIAAEVLLPPAAEPETRPLTPMPPMQSYYGQSLVGRGTPIALDAFVALAIEKNIPLASGRITPRISKASILAARAAFDPTLGLSSGITTRERTLFAFAPSSDVRTAEHVASVTGTLPTSTQYTVSVTTTRVSSRNAGTASRVGYTNAGVISLAQPLLRGAGPWIVQAPIRIARLNADAAVARLSRLVENTIAQTENFYNALSEAEENERAAAESLARSEEVLRRNRELERLDLIPAIDLITAEHNVASRAAVFVNASRARQDAAEAIITFVFGEEARKKIAADSYLVRTSGAVLDVPQLPDPEHAVADAIATRPDVTAARRDYASSVVALNAAKNALLPTVNLTGTLTRGGTANGYNWSFEHQGEVQDDRYFAGVVVSIPIGNNSAQAAHEQARLAREQQRLAVAEAQQTAGSQVRAAIRAVIANQERMQLAVEAEQLTRKQYELAKKSLELGLIDTFRLLQHEEDVLQAQTATITAQRALQQAITAYRLATGTIIGNYYPGGVS